MTVFNRYWFPASVIALLGIIAVNLYALSFRQTPQGAGGGNVENRHAHAIDKDNTKTPAEKEHDAHNPSKDAPDAKKAPADHAANDHKGMMDHT